MPKHARRLVLWPQMSRYTRWQYNALTQKHRKVVDPSVQPIAQPKTGRELYEALDRYLGLKQERPGHSGSVRITRRHGDTIAVHLFSTDIITVNREGEIVLDWNGWYTQSTNRHMNAYLPRRMNVSGLKKTYLTVDRWNHQYLVGGYGASVGGRVVITPRRHVSWKDGNEGIERLDL